MSIYRHQINWLHISDIHFRAIERWRDKETRDALLACIKDQIEYQNIAKPDLIFCTGDIGYGDEHNQKLSEQYEDAKEFFRRLLQITRLETDRLFLVPGNHDVSRGLINKITSPQYLTMADNSHAHIDRINADIGNLTNEYTECMNRLQTYKNFVSEFTPHLHEEKNAHYTRSININGNNIQITGLNSAWNCSGEEKDRKLWLGARAQLNGVDRSASIRIALMHHPIDWLVVEEQQVLNARFGHDFDIFLHGHTHDYKVSLYDGDFPVMGAGAISTGPQPDHGFISVSLNLETSELNKKVFQYSSNGNYWDMRSDKSRSHLKIKLPKTSTNPSPPDTHSELSSEITYKEYFSRPGHEFGRYFAKYKESIEPGNNSQNSDSRYFYYLWSDAMSYHAVSVLAENPEELHYQKGHDSQRLFKKDNIDAYFIRKIMKKNKLSETSNSDPVDIRNRQKSFDESLRDFSDSPQGLDERYSESSENKIRYLIGDAGAGKTITVLKMLDSLRVSKEKEEKEAQAGKKEKHGFWIHPIYIDLLRNKQI